MYDIVCMSYSADRAVDVILQRKNIPAMISRTQLQLLYIEPFQDVRILKLRICRSNGRLESTSQVVEIERDGRFGKFRAVCVCVCVCVCMDIHVCVHVNVHVTS